MKAAPIYVVVCSYVDCYDKRFGPIVFETDVEGATLEEARDRAGDMERLGEYGPCRVGRVVFEDEPGFIPEGSAK